MKRVFQFVVVALLAGAGWRAAAAGDAATIDPHKFVVVALPAEGPLQLDKVDYGDSRITRSERGMRMELNLVLTVRNRSSKVVEGLALSLGYGFGRPGAEGLSAVSGLRLEPGESYNLPARMQAEIDLPPPGSRARVVDLPSSVRLRLDSVLFSDGSAYGSDSLRALGSMRVNQAESQRDRAFFQRALQSGGVPRLVPLLEGASQAPPQPGAQASPASGPRVLAGEGAERARALAQIADFRVVRFAGAPLEIVSARGRVYDRGLVDPALDVRNVTNAEITDFQATWVLRDGSGREFRAATTSASAGKAINRSLPLPPGELLAWASPAVLETSTALSGPIISGRVYLRAVQFADGRVWVPDRGMLQAAGLAPILGASPEAIRLLRVYRVRGPEVLVRQVTH